MAEARDEQMEQGPSSEPGIEIQDIDYWMDQMDNYVRESQAMNTRMNHALQQIRDTVAARDRLNGNVEIQEDVERTDSEKLSDTALKLIEKTVGPLIPDKFHEFLVHSSYRKPHPPVLPILRGYSSDVEGVGVQLDVFKMNLKRAHNEYQIERKKDTNLEKRIERLVRNIIKELIVENGDGLHQSSILSFFPNSHS